MFGFFSLFTINAPCFDMLWYLMQLHSFPFQRNSRCVRVVMLWEHLCMFVSWSMCEISRRLQLRGPDASGVMPLRAALSGGKWLTPHHTVPATPQCPQGIVLPTPPSLVLQGTVVSSDFGSQCLPEALCHWLAPSKEGYRGVSSVVLCWSSASGRWADNSKNTRDQFWETGSLSRPSGSLILILLNSTGSYPQW